MRPTSTLSERLLFVIWLSAKVLGTNTGQAFAAAVGKQAAQLSKWLNGELEPSWATIKVLADGVKISAAWLDDPTRPEAVEPPDFATWLAAQRSQRDATRKASGER